MTTETNKIKDEEAEFTEIDPLKDDSNKQQGRSLAQKVCTACRHTTVEPSIMLFMVSVIITTMASSNLALEKACRVNLNYTTEICDALKARQTEGFMEYEVAVQRLAAKTMAWKTMLTSSIPCILALFVGSWSDRTGHRKVFIILPMLGQVLLCVSNMIHNYFFYELSLQMLVLTEAIIESLSGSWCFCIMSVFSFMTAITTNKNRTFRLGITNFAMTVGFPIGLALSGFMVKKGFYVAYGIAACLQAINCVYNVVILKNPMRTPAQKLHDRKGAIQFFRTFFDLGNVKQTFGVMIKDFKRKMLLLSTACLLFGSLHGEMSIVYLLTRYRYNWDEVKFSIFQTYNFIIHTVGTVFSITVFSRRLQWHDSLLGIISTVSKICANTLYFFAYNEFLFYIGPLVEILNGTALLAARAMMTKLVKPDEIGKVNSLLSMSENLMPLVFVPIYTRTYSASMETFPGMVFLLGSAMVAPASVSFCWLFYDQRKQLKRTQEHNTKIVS